jgi:hypothetical protein
VSLTGLVTWQGGDGLNSSARGSRDSMVVLLIMMASWCQHTASDISMPAPSPSAHAPICPPPTTAYTPTTPRELAIQLRRDVAPQLAASGTKLFLVSIGTLERSAAFAEVTGFNRDCLLADPGSVSYEALGLVKGVRQTFFGREVSHVQSVLLTREVCVCGGGGK